MTPVYPKENPEYRERVLERFRKLVRDTRWDTCEDKISLRGRKPKKFVRVEAKPRSSEKYNWL
jgi:hypothetical protein